jgi:transposase
MKTYTGIDHHKQYSVACTLDVQGRKVAQAKLAANAPEAFAAYFAQFDEPSEVVIEACWNWGAMHDLLETTPGVQSVTVSHPAKNRIIAEAQIKNDKVDAQALATLLRGNFVSRVHVPSRSQRSHKNVIRQRLWLARLRTMVRNRIHTVIDRHPQLERPEFADLFGRKGLAWMARAPVPEADRLLLDEALEMHKTVQAQIAELEARIDKDHEDNPLACRLRTLPGVGRILAPVIALEIDQIERFRTADKLCAYAGLVPTTHASGGKVSHGRTLPFCNRWLKWAFVEAAWVAVGCSDYFGSFYRKQRNRGKKANQAIIITARRLAKIAWKLLVDRRDYSMERPVPADASMTLSPAALCKD